MLGLQRQLNTSALLEHAGQHHAGVEIVSHRAEGDIHRTTYAEVAARARRVAGALDALQLGPGERVATLASNGYRHLELYFGVSASGRVLHPLNLHLRAEPLAAAIHAAGDRVVCFDMAFLPLIQAVQARCPGVKAWVALCDADRLPTGAGIAGLVAYEAWIGPHPAQYAWPLLDENSAASLGYSHRSTVLHAFGAALSEAIQLSARDSVMPVVPLLHANAWGLHFAALMSGARLVYPCPGMDGASIFELIETERVTVALGAPAVWPMLLGHMHAHQLRFSTLKRMVIGQAPHASAIVQAFQQRYGVKVLAGWGMTERIVAPEAPVEARSSADAQGARSSRALHSNSN